MKKIIYAVSYNSAGGWNMSQRCRIVAETENYISALAIDAPICHDHNFKRYGKYWYKFGERIVIPRQAIMYEENGTLTF